ncbi:hypothetical protein P8452_12715 [Trifolium repens]|nr:hypothetical protein P8452_12715 [Trifolium repens]
MYQKKTFNEDLFKEIAHFLTLEIIRENEYLSHYGDDRSTRVMMLRLINQSREGSERGFKETERRES